MKNLLMSMFENQVSDVRSKDGLSKWRDDQRKNTLIF